MQLLWPDTKVSWTLKELEKVTMHQVTKDKQQHFADLVDRNRAHVKVVTDIALFCAKQGIALRGHREDAESMNRGNFLELFELMCAYDPEIKKRLDELPGNGKMMSPDIQNDLLETAASLLLRKIKAELHTPTDTYAILADEYKDLSKNELIAVCVRYIHNGNLRERAVGFVATEDMTSSGIANKILEVLEPLQRDPELCVGFGFDGASVMSGLQSPSVSVTDCIHMIEGLKETFDKLRNNSDGEFDKIIRLTDEVMKKNDVQNWDVAGAYVQDIFSMLANTGEATDYAAAVRALNLYFVPQVNAAFARQTFHKLTQNSASEQYQHKVANALTGIEGVENISDDIIVHAHDQETHDRRLHAVLTRLTERGLTLNPDKCQFNMDKLVFMGILLSEKGIGPTAERVKDTPFEFGSEQREAFNALKNELARAGTLAYFDKDSQTKVIADASPVGLGAVLVQVQQGEEVPICYVSRSLSDCERKYSQTEREALGLVLACERLHPYVYGRQFTLVTDHKPLEVIYGPHSKPCARIERWVLRLQPYDFKVLYIPGKQNIADSLSRLLGETAKRERHNHGSDEYLRFVAVSATPKALTTREVEEASATDPELIEVREAIANGRFENCKAYAAIANELCVVGYLVLRGTRIVLPRILHARALTLAHEGHLGIVGTKQHLRTKVWWPGMDRAAERHCKDCHGCQIVARPDPPEPLRPTPLPDGPWRDVALDLLGPLPSNHSILVVVDYYSRYYEYDILTSTTTEKVIDSLESIFSRHGLPVTCKSDNGPQFKSELFREYCENNGITHLKATAKWAQANGEVERQNASLMKRIRIAHSEGLDWKRELRKYVTVYRSIDHATTGKSPAKLLFNRKVRGKLPDVTESRTDMEVRDRDSEQKGKSKLYADERRRAQRSEIEVGDTVLVRQDKVDKFTTPFNATPHKVVSKAGSHVIVESPTRARYTRNSTFVKKYRTTGPEETTHEQDDTQGVEEVMVDYGKDTVTPPTPTDTSMSDMPNAGRPQRNKQAPQRLSDYVVT
ncbi:hypothetical protein SKAU_G00060600 [Synaphobranchus kaupii]|uniref:Gypsy retrotransposon integrase-like protein 1 n=1 Tax=Synaphobranchus kaupii TaxID=118154 RepID=A0A9Q1JAQ1_SYNKA|nr:hypothetical protein SKAU_G00060600 [Synaphobranchus kaupii]